MSLANKYLKIATEIVSSEIYDKKSISAHNDRVDALRKIAIDIDKNAPHFKNEFCKLLYHDNPKICTWVAHHVLEVMSCEKSHRKRALRIIKKNAEQEYGEKLWLKDWYKSHPFDRFI